jgi:hypothetical protein
MYIDKNFLILLLIKGTVGYFIGRYARKKEMNFYLWWILGTISILFLIVINLIVSFRKRNDRNTENDWKNEHYNR